MKTENLTKQEAEEAMKMGYAALHPQDMDRWYSEENELYYMHSHGNRGKIGEAYWEKLPVTGWRIYQPETAQHTPLPWLTRKAFENPIECIDPEDVTRKWLHNSTDIVDETGRIIAYVPFSTDTTDQGWGNNETLEKWEANTRLIVKAVNNHDALVEALKRIAFRSEGNDTFETDAQIAAAVLKQCEL